MNIKHILATATAAAVLGTAGISIAGAASDAGNSTLTSPAATSGGAPSAGSSARPSLGHRRRLVRRALELAADTIGVDTLDLVRELRAGKSIAQVATAHNVDPQTVIDALVNAATTKIEAAKDAGKITAKRAAAIEQKLPELVSKLVNHAGLRAPGKAKAQDKRHQRVRHAVELAAQTIGIDAKDLASELRAGKSIAEVATAHNVDPQTVIDALVNAATTKIEAAKNAGKITAERAAAIEQKLPELVSKLVNHHFGARLNAGAGV